MSNNFDSSNSDTFTRKKTPSAVPFVFAFIFLVLFVAMVVKTAGGKSPISFTGLLEYLSSINRPFVNFAISDYTITADWGLINGLRDIINVIMSVVGVAVFIGKSLVNSFAYLFQILGFLLF